MDGTCGVAIVMYRQRKLENNFVKAATDAGFAFVLFLSDKRSCRGWECDSGCLQKIVYGQFESMGRCRPSGKLRGKHER